MRPQYPLSDASFSSHRSAYLTGLKSPPGATGCRNSDLARRRIGLSHPTKAYRPRKQRPAAGLGWRSDFIPGRVSIGPQLSGAALRF
jgi:hypothetical protein